MFFFFRRNILYFLVLLSDFLIGTIFNTFIFMSLSKSAVENGKVSIFKLLLVYT